MNTLKQKKKKVILKMKLENYLEIVPIFHK